MNTYTTLLILSMITIIHAYDNTTCIDCENFINILKRAVENSNSTFNELIHFIEMICSNIFGPGGKECLLITKNIESILELIYNHTNTTKICEDLYMC